eukprot:CAMPEP_0177549152 /NCGR_PEP_ID=MMETSP0369-20130122/64866_1 /TAXON_ID=447022 ORGANISM="Scrippsiella hangoei-like, Strain SHHI-4" /NCGR_SAMPLE_ID=MMETSP0369 /ASSEMBLY_ACC=CAM_ASM_000364 /LENGTH=65 /DNA_ID=CAMNT_0019034227 /DNA_START=1 /DNA_END=194 /DNA_ORIENTATION=+
MAAAALANISEFLPQDLSNMAWAFSVFVVFHATLMNAISAQAIRSISIFETQNLSNTVWAWATCT